MTLNLTDENFSINLLLNFPFAYDEDKEIMLFDFMTENFKMPTDDWFNELTGKTDENGNEIEPWDGYTFFNKINKNVTFYAEFHPSETVYFFNETYLGNSGGNFRLSLLTWSELMKIVNHNKKNPSLIFLLLLPLTIGNESEKEEIEQEITKHLKQTVLNPAHFPTITNFLVKHLIFDDHEMNVFEHKKGIGLVNKRNHSERNRNNDEADLIAINEIIELATK
jgi:hypothetical protein